MSIPTSFPKWPMHPNGHPKHPGEMTQEDKTAAADLVAHAITDGAPGAGANFLIGARERFGAATNLDLLRSLIGVLDPEQYLDWHWKKQIADTEERLRKMRPEGDPRG